MGSRPKGENEGPVCHAGPRRAKFIEGFAGPMGGEVGTKPRVTNYMRALPSPENGDILYESLAEP